MTIGFSIIGISVRTTNKDGQSQQDLGQLWEKFFSEGMYDKIPNKESDEIFSVYTDYKSDYTEEYTTIIGVPVTTLEEIPTGMIGREFPSENFQEFLAKGPLPKAVADKWMGIWEMDAELNRKYTYDFEVYGEYAQKGDNSEVAIYIAIK